MVVVPATRAASRSIGAHAEGLGLPEFGNWPRIRIEDAVSRVFAVDREQLRSLSRGKAPVARARQVAMYLAHVGLGLSLTEVGELFARDRTTVAHACAVVEDLRDDTRFDRVLECLESIVRYLVMEHPVSTAGGRGLAA